MYLRIYCSRNVCHYMPLGMVCNIPKTSIFRNIALTIKNITLLNFPQVNSHGSNYVYIPYTDILTGLNATTVVSPASNMRSCMYIHRPVLQLLQFHFFQINYGSSFRQKNIKWQITKYGMPST